MKKQKSLLTLIVGLIATAVLTGCGCSKDVNPTKINVDATSVSTFVGQSVDINYSISPVSSTKTEVSVSVNKPNVVSLSSTTLNGVNGKVTVTGLNVDMEGAVVTFSINGTKLSTSTTVVVRPDPVKLTAPDVSYISFLNTENKIRFRVVPNAVSYKIDIDGTVYDVADPEPDSPLANRFIEFDVFNDNVFLNYDQGHIVKVKAVGDSLNFTDSDFSEEYKFIKLSKVTGVTALNGVLTWDNNNLADRYQIEVNGEVKSDYPTTNTYTLSVSSVGAYEIRVKASHDVTTKNEQGYYVFEGDYSDVYTITKIGKPNLELNNEGKQNNITTFSEIVWNAVLGASSYEVTVSPANELSETTFTVLSDENLKIVLDENYLPNTKYTFTILPIGDSTITIEGEQNTISVTKTSAVSNFDISNNILTFDAIVQCGGYELVLTNGSSQTAIKSNQSQFNLAEMISVAGTYSLSVRTLGLKTEILTLANSQLVNSNLTITKLKSPTVSGVNNSGVVGFEQVEGANNYQIYLDGNYVASTSTNSYALNFGDITSGSHTVKVQAIGDGTQTISSGIENAINYQFNKLGIVSSISVADDTISFESVNGAINFSIKVNNGTPVLNGVSSGIQTYKVNSEIVNGTNYITIVTVGDDIKNISSDEKVFEISRLTAPQNLRVENGSLLWDNSESVYYMVFVGNDENGVRVNTGEYSSILLTQQNVVVRVKAFSVNGGYFSSDFATITVNKLGKVLKSSIKTVKISNDNLNPNYKLVWDAVGNATSYNITVADTLRNEIQTEYLGVTETYINIPNNYVADTYTITIRANGNSATIGTGYLNSDIETFTFKKLDIPQNIKITDGVLTWEYRGTPKPESYTIGIVYNDEEEVFVTADNTCTYKLDAYGTQPIMVRIRANGNNDSLVTGDYSNPTEVARLTAVTNLKVKNGTITFDKHEISGVRYNIYANDELISNPTFTYGTSEVMVNIPSLIPSTEYSIKVEAYLQGYLLSAKTDALKVYKLAPVENFDISNGVFGWDVLSNASSYEISDNNGTVKTTTQNSLNFSEFGFNDGGVYNFNIRAIGSVDEYQIGYLTSAYSANALSISLVSAPVAQVVNSVVVITPNTNEKLIPAAYQIVISSDTDEAFDIICVEFSSVYTTLDLTELELPVGTYTIMVYSVGNNKNIIALNTPTVLNNIKKLDKNLANLKISGGVISWNSTILGATFDVYLKDGDSTVKKLSNYAGTTAEFSDLEKGKQYEVCIVIKQNGAIDSDKSSVLKVTKLPDVSGLKVINDNGTLKFSWNGISTADKYTNTNKFFYEVSPVTPLEPFNGKTASGAITTLAFTFDYPEISSAQFKIRAMGSISETLEGYLNGDISVNALTVSKLSSVTNIAKNEGNLLTWQNSNENATGIKLIFMTADSTTYEFDLPSEATSFDVTANLDPDIYSLSIIVLGDINNAILDSAQVDAPNIEVLPPVSMISAVNGYLTWSELDSEMVFEVYADGVKLTQTIEVEGEEGSTTEIVDYFENFSQSITINEQLVEEKNIVIKIRSKKLSDTENTLTFYSKFSAEFTVNKVASVSDLHFEENLLKWTPVPHATGYVIKVENALASEIFGDSLDFSPELDGIKVVGDEHGRNGYELPNSVPAGIYSFYVIALGSTTSSMSEIGYLTSEKSNNADVSILPEPTNLRVENGYIKWDEVTGAQKYQVAVSSVNVGGIQTETVFFTGKTSEGLETAQFGSALYSVTVTVIGNGTTMLNSHPTEISTIKVYKPKAVQNYKVVNGFVYWEMPFNDELMIALNNNEPYTEEQKALVLSALLAGPNGADMATYNNYEFLNNVEATINGIVFTNMHPYTIEMDENQKCLKFTFDFNFTNNGLRNPYSIKLRYLGSGFNNAIMLSDGGEDTQVVANFVNGLYSEEIVAYKLPSPQTPIVNAIVGTEPVMTMVKNNNLYFMSVGARDEFVVDYLITAVSKITNAKLTKIISGNSNQYLPKNDNGDILSTNVYCVPISELELNAGEGYTINVRAIGTKDSATIDENEKIYLTSNYQNTCDVQLLESPQIKIIDGSVSVSIPSNAQTINLRIWDIRTGTEFDPNKHNEAEQIVVINIVINEASVAENMFLTMSDGFYLYTLSNNPLFTDGSYYVQAIAEGDGITQVSSKVSGITQIVKTKPIQSVTLKDGKFTWDAINYTYDKYGTPITIKAVGYKIDIYRSAYIGDVQVENSTEFIMQYFIKASEVASSDLTRCYFDLPSNNALFPATATTEDGTTVVYKYAAEICLKGTTHEDETWTYGANNVVNSDTTISREYARLSAPLNLRMVEGTLQWNAVNRAVSYEVYMLDVTYGFPEEELGVDYGIISNGDIRQLYFEALNLQTGKLYSIIIRALPGGGDTEYLNGEYTPEIYTRKLDNPLVRIEDGIIKWNVTELDLAVATKVNIKVTGPEGFTNVDTVVDINNMVNGENGYLLTGSDDDYPTGDYTLSVWFSGSNGLIPVIITDPEDNPSEEGPIEGEEGTDNNEEVLNKLEESEVPPEGETQSPTFTQDAYCWFSSGETTITATKLQTLTASRYMLDGANYIKVAPVENASKYTFTVLKYDKSTGEVIKTYTTPTFTVGTVDHPSISTHDGNIIYNLADVAEYDEKHQGETILFGTEFSVYAQAFGYDRLYSDSESKFIISNPSNEVPVEIPVAPSNVTYEYPGTIRWTNYSKNTYTRVKVEYDDISVGTKIYNLTETNVSSFKLKDVGTATVSVLSYIVVGDQEILSSYTTLETKVNYLIYSSGNGSIENPYVITNSEQVGYIKYNMDSNFVLNNDVTFTASAPPDQRPQNNDGFVVNGKGVPFTGTFDGNNKTISNINYTGIYATDMAFMHTVGSSGVIKDLTLTIMGTDIKATNFAGVAINNNGTISNVTVSPVSGSITYSITNASKIGGIVAFNNGTINDCYNNLSFLNNGSFKTLETQVSGIASENKGRITKCGNNGTLSGVVVGGISSQNYGTIAKCYNKGDMQAITTVSILQPIIGGIVGYNQNAQGSSIVASVTDCYAIINNITISTVNTNSYLGVAGGIVAATYNNATIANSYVVINLANSVNTTNSSFGVILGSSSVTVSAGANYNNNAYLLVQGGSYQTYGQDSTKKLAELVNTKENLVTMFTTNAVLQAIYKADSDNVNNGYPVFK